MYIHRNFDYSIGQNKQFPIEFTLSVSYLSKFYRKSCPVEELCLTVIHYVSNTVEVKKR